MKLYMRVRNKLTQESVEKIFSDVGAKFDDIFTNSNKSYNYICICGNSDKVFINNFKRGSRCKSCSKVKMRKSHEFEKFTYEQVKEYIESFGYQLLSSIYINSREYIELLCPKGHIYRVKFKAFKNGHRCSTCYTGNHKKGYNYAKNIFESQGYILRSETYKDIKTKMDVICPIGHEYSVCLYSFETNGSRCSECYYKSMCGEGHPRYKNFLSKKQRLIYLHIEKNKINKILYDDPNYNEYIKNIKDKTGRNIYSIDHIFPKIAFIDNDLDKIYKADQIKEICNSRDNLRIILNNENNSKNGKYNQEEFISWLQTHPKYFLLENKDIK